MGSLDSSSLITGLAHVNLTVPAGTLEQANEFYGTTMGLTPRAVPQLQKGTLAWFDIGSSGQQVHVAFGAPSDFEKRSSRHPCFRLASPEALLQLRQRIWEHFVRGGEAAPTEADKPGDVNSGEPPLYDFFAYLLSSRAGEKTKKGITYPCIQEYAVKLTNAAGLCEKGSQGVEYPQRFFARDYAGNRLEFSL
ncbi:hypothetical protein AYO20_11254 [Fonsecaea nubica]|uniref:VOC domain-containing protein n=1 Tax=Fonsecaea nubica TaxID=856822 RepID=A0A178BWS4_9EURO|nr:hypothetical protein AYO20_11254 [Fonsecaea nubica]OAL22060.1 hypothetical protein AYO20_11254 [Fonsecaea nubica]